MGKGAERLTVKEVENARKPGMYRDGRGLYLRVAPGGSKHWIYRYSVAAPGTPRGRRARDMSLGSVEDHTLAEARELAREARQQRKLGHDPIAERTKERAKRQAEASKTKTLRECGEQWLVDMSTRWLLVTARGHAQRLADYAYPRLGTLHIAEIDTPLILEVLKPLWARNSPHLGNDVRETIGGVLEWAIAHGLRPEGTNPASWKILKHALPRPEEARPVRHMSSLPYQQLPDYYARLLRDADKPVRGPARDPTGSLCVRFTILTVVRIEEAIGARWDEVDYDNRVWIIPAERMKGRKAKKREHAVPLSTEALAVLKEAEAFKRNDYIFPGNVSHGYFNKTTALFVAKRTLDPTFRARGKYAKGQYKDVPITNHGFRATFATWAAEQTHFERDVRECALAHQTETKVSGSYQRSTLFQKRTQLMQAWADFVTGTTAKVVPLPLRKA
jgi:integrase